MISKRLFVLCASLVCLFFTGIYGQGPGGVIIPKTKFSCYGRPSGYYADVETGCQVYHMCDGLGRQFSFVCPNTTLFQQRMLVCDHWYMVNCSKSESNFKANLLIGQRDKPFVSDSEMQDRTPRPDILSVPPGNNYYEGLKEAESKFPFHPDNSIVGAADSLSHSNNNGLDSGKNHYRPPTSWSTGTHNQRPTTNGQFQQQSTTHDGISGAASQHVTPTIQPKPSRTTIPPAKRPSQDLLPPLSPTTTTDANEDYIDIRMDESEDDKVLQFINRFDPNSPEPSKRVNANARQEPTGRQEHQNNNKFSAPDAHNTAMTRTEIINLNRELPQGQNSAEDERTPRVQNLSNRNSINISKPDKNNVDHGKNADDDRKDGNKIDGQGLTISTVKEPSKVLELPKTDYVEQSQTTVGPPIYYDWKWAVPAFDLEPPKFSNVTNNATVSVKSRYGGRSPFENVTTTTPKIDLQPSFTEYNISSYYVPDYIFPLDNAHPGYENKDAESSFLVKLGRSGRSYGENPNCPQCHPAYLEPGKCEPCIVKR